MSKQSKDTQATTAKDEVTTDEQTSAAAVATEEASIGVATTVSPAETDASLAPADEDELAYEDEDDLDSEDSLTFSNGVIEKIVAIAMREVPGVIGMKGGWVNRVQDVFGQHDPRTGVIVEVTPESAVRVNISVMMEYGAYAPQVFEDVKRTVVKQVTGMTGLDVAGVNLRIEDVLTPEEYAESKRNGNQAADEDEPTDVEDDGGEKE